MLSFFHALLICVRFRTGKGYGFSAHFIGNTLVLETAGRSHKKPQTHPLPTSFHSYQVPEPAVCSVQLCMALSLIEPALQLL